MVESIQRVKVKQDDGIFILLCTWLIGGIFVDGWAHNHLARLETFFTPWHALLYSGFLAVAGYLFVTIVRNHQQGAPWREAVPPGYELSLCGMFVFLLGGLADMTWHILFGIEQNVEALLSPTHLLLAFGATWIVAGPLRVAVSRTVLYEPGSFKIPYPAILSIAYILSLLIFFTQFANPIVHSWADVRTAEPLISLGLASILLQTVIEMSVVLFLVRQWKVPFGAFALIFMIEGGLSTILANNTLLVVIVSVLYAALIGLIVDGLYKWLQPSIKHGLEWNLFAFLVPVLERGAYFFATMLLHGVVWSIHLWLGSIIMSGIIGVLLGYLLAPQTKSEQTDLFK